MKQSLEYTLVAEGFAEYSFIPVYLKRIASARGLQVKRSSLDLLKKQPSKSKVIQEAEDLCLRALRDEQQAFCIVGVDLDGPDHTDEQEKYTMECDNLKKALGSAHKRYEQQIVIYVTIQAIEHWLFYQLHQIKSIDKPVKDSIEKQPQAKLKKLLYNGREDRRQMESVARSIAEKADFDELAKQSRSFNHFHKQITAFLNEYNKT
ncbi:hypothetical protein BN8_00292 [Fibrisoma limi BUZ 3]|uniref:DUF4276 family protein n=1 Tax=Fibrisoma limi BUZ 3 TaxID=1185876 RepID=I2GBU8_9BACT|nr:DUF4276 family protein [Fibrisoma limi]CCH51372.1 hypothetical protein BN8_00292 [Fibrisoma limi BUZ 3]